MNEMQVFKYENDEVRTVEQSGEIWWVLADVCRVLSVKNNRDASRRLDEDEKGVAQIDTLGGSQKMTIISESGLYKIILRSDKPKAKEFTRWVTHEVLPTIRKTGGYGNQTAGLTKLAGQMAQAATAMVTVVDKLTGLVDRMSSPPITLEGELDSTPRLFCSGTANCLKLETFPDEIVDEVDRMLALMREQQALNFSQIARFCTMNGYTISSPSVKRYFDRHFQKVSDGQR